MNEWNLSSPLVAREELEDCWRGKLEEAQQRYQDATKRYQKSRQEAHGLPAENNAMFVARHEQSEALMEFQRLLKIFSELAVHGRVPEAESTENTREVAR